LPPVPVPPTSSSRFCTSANVFTGDSCQEKQVLTSLSVEPIQLSLSESNRARSGATRGSSGIARSKVAISVPSLGAVL
jgi:hypothetical protein